MRQARHTEESEWGAGKQVSVATRRRNGAAGETAGELDGLAGEEEGWRRLRGSRLLRRPLGVGLAGSG